MKEKFKLSLFLILLAMTATNVNAAITSKPEVFVWQGYIPTINPLLDWELVDRFGNPYTPETANLTPKQDVANSDVLMIEGAPIKFFIAPKYHGDQPTGTNVINGVTAKLIQRPMPNGFTNNDDITNAATTVLADNQVAITVNGDLIKEADMPVREMGSNPALFEVSIVLKAKIPASNYTVGSSIGFSVPIMFSVNVMDATPTPP